MQPTPDLNWDNLRVFLSVMRSTSMRDAADKLGVSHPTIGRRIEALETELGLQLFDHRNDGLHATTEAVELMELAQQIETSVHALGRRALDADSELTGPIRVSMPETIATDLLVDELVAFSARWPQIELRIEVSYDFVNLGSREADVAIRGVRHGKAPEGDLTGRLVGTAYGAIYGSEHQWIGFHGEERDRKQIETTKYADLPVCGSFPSFALQRAACAKGMGLSRLPCYFAEPILERRTKPEPLFDIWVLVHSDLRRNPRLRIFRDEMFEALKSMRPRLKGALPLVSKSKEHL